MLKLALTEAVWFILGIFPWLTFVISVDFIVNVECYNNNNKIITLSVIRTVTSLVDH